MSSPRSTSLEKASGTEAAEVLPESTTSWATTACGAPSRRTTASMIRRLAWCVTMPPRSPTATPARRQASSAIGARVVVAQRKTAWPSWAKRGCQAPASRTASARVGSEPHTTGPMPGSVPGAASAALTTAAPAPSPSRTQVLRSLQSVRSDIFSAPMTRACRAAPARTEWSAAASAVVKPAQALLRS